jgi:hypothetical protein
MQVSGPGSKLHGSDFEIALDSGVGSYDAGHDDWPIAVD